MHFHSTGCSTFIIIIRVWYNGPISGRRTKWTQSHPPKELKKKLLDNTLCYDKESRTVNLMLRMPGFLDFANLIIYSEQMTYFKLHLFPSSDENLGRQLLSFYR
jgi:hypothetical protein